MIRQIVTVSSGTLVSRMSGFLRDALIAALLGAGAAADAFLFAFQLVNVARRLLNEGALNAALTPTYLALRRKSGPHAAAAFAGELIATLNLILAGIALVLGLAMPQVVALLAPGFQDHASFSLAVDFARLMLPYLAFAAPVAIIGGVLNANDRYGLTATGPLLFNLTLIAAIAVLLLAEAATTKTAATALALIVGGAGVLQLALLALRAAGLARPLRLTLDARMRRFLRQAAPGMIAQAGPQLMLVGASVVASASPSAVAWLYFASRLVELPLGIISGATSAVLIARLADAQTSHRQIAAAQARALQLTLGLAVPAALGLASLAHPIIALLFENGAFAADDTRRTAQALTLLALGLPGHALAKLLAASFFARGNTMTPCIAIVAGLGCTILAGALLFADFGYLGAAAGISAGAWLSASILAIALAAGPGLAIDRRSLRNLAKIGIAALLMTLAVKLAQPDVAASAALWRQAGSLALSIAFGLAVYFAALRLLGVVSLTDIRASLKSGHR